MLRKYFNIFQTVIYQYDKNMMHAYKTTNLIFHSRYPLAKKTSFETVSDGWMNQVFLTKLLFNKGYVISVENVYREICKSCDFPAPSFDIFNKIVLKYKSTDINFSNFIINHPENKLFDKCTFLNNNINVNIPRREKRS